MNARARFATATDAELVRAAAAGDRHAVAVVWHRYAPASRRCLKTKLGFREDVEDLMQDVFVCFLASVHRIRNQGSLRAYLLAITATRAAHEVRRRRVRRIVSLSATGVMPEIPAPPPDYEGRESLHSLQRVLARLPLRARAVYCLFHFSGLEIREVARRVGVSLSTAKRTIARARKRVAQLTPAEAPLQVAPTGTA